ncbi:hypothetical protein Pint_25773 [Pistacia integerrima]|uniref:Uncharacterized protein n=1 Tax=Pistacia integerrima TaxID=434235 RepID=A0ACC0YGF3_9ROSI|nr:hypothetical protein Pint_25773 [Pistacia integerrima]
MEQIQNLNSSNPSVALIVGVTGMAGFSLAQALNNHHNHTWKIHGVARRPPQLHQLRRIKLHRHSRKTLPNLQRSDPRLLGGLPALRNGRTQRRQELRNAQKRTRRAHKSLSF